MAQWRGLNVSFLLERFYAFATELLLTRNLQHYSELVKVSYVWKASLPFWRSGWKQIRRVETHESSARENIVLKPFLPRSKWSCTEGLQLYWWPATKSRWATTLMRRTLKALHGLIDPKRAFFSFHTLALWETRPFAERCHAICKRRMRYIGLILLVKRL